MISNLENSNTNLFYAWKKEVRRGEAERAFIRLSGRYPLTSYGRLNTYSLFAELAGSIISSHGLWGMVLPTGIATDAFNQYFFGYVVNRKVLCSFFSFENEEFIFPAIHHATKFALMTVAGESRDKDPELAFSLRSIDELDKPYRRYRLSSSDINLINPNTATCPVFRTSQDAAITAFVLMSKNFASVVIEPSDFSFL